MAKTGHKSLRSVARYVKPGLAAVHQATDGGRPRADPVQPPTPRISASHDGGRQ